MGRHLQSGWQWKAALRRDVNHSRAKNMIPDVTGLGTPLFSVRYWLAALYDDHNFTTFDRLFIDIGYE
jgi:hypothetical protein